MHPFSELSPRGRRRRLHALAVDVLRNYEPDIAATGCRLVAASFNNVFRVTACGPRSYALRVGAAQRIHSPGTEEAEVAWMTALRHDGTCGVAEVLVAGDRRSVLRQHRGDVSDERICVLFDWVGGRPLAASPGVELVRRAGELAATLHEHAAAHPLLVAPVSADRVLYWTIDDRLASLTPRYGSLFREAQHRAQVTIDGLWRRPPHPPHLLHGDFTADNIMVRGREMIPIDFQDLVRGFDIQDVAVALLSLRRFADAEALTAAFLRGYRTIRSGRDFDPDVVADLMLGRRIHQVNLGLTLQRAGLAEFVDGAAGFLREVMGRSTAAF